MTKEEIMERVGELLYSPGIRIEARDGIIFVYKLCYTMEELAMVLKDDTVEFDGIVYEL